jgi:uncharacterized protein (DUF58 family)
VVGCAIVAWVAGWQLGWVELMVIAAAAVVLFLLCALLTIGRTLLRVVVEVDPPRVVVGQPAAGRVLTTNISKLRLLPIALELPIGASSARFLLPSLHSAAGHEELFVVPTARRAVIPIGPATTVRGDPLGLLRRKVSWTQVTELFVHPRTVPLEPLGSGLLRDLEGQSTNDISMSDLAFHALREYAPGDDRRHIHWRSSAKVGAFGGGGAFLVRQYLDTRRSHLSVVVDGDLSAYPNPDDFEAAASVGASVAVRAIRDEMQTTVVIAQVAVESASAQLTLDAFSRAEPVGGQHLPGLSARAAHLAPDTSVVLLVTGANTPFVALRRAALHFAPEVNKIALRIDPSRPAGISAAGGVTVLSLSTLADLPALLRGAGAL